MRRNLPDRRAAGRAATLALAAGALALSAGCARKNEPVPPKDAVRPAGPVYAAPGEVTDPIGDLDE